MVAHAIPEPWREVFDGINPNGTWTLYVYDDNDGTSSGAMTDGWSLKIKAKVQK